MFVFCFLQNVGKEVVQPAKAKAPPKKAPPKKEPPKQSDSEDEDDDDDEEEEEEEEEEADDADDDGKLTNKAAMHYHEMPNHIDNKNRVVKSAIY